MQGNFQGIQEFFLKPLRKRKSQVLRLAYEFYSVKLAKILILNKVVASFFVRTARKKNSVSSAPRCDLAPAEAKTQARLSKLVIAQKMKICYNYIT